jgi:hypothetical protein
VYNFYSILYFLIGLIAIGNTCLFIALVMSIEDKETERKRPQQKNKKRKKKMREKEDPQDDKVGWTVMNSDDDGNIIIEEI